MPENHLKIEVLGNAKTGTTGLFNSIRAPLREQHPDALLLFEPRSSVLFRLARHQPSFSILAKAMINKNGTQIGYTGFTHHVLISRDPRDTLVSQLLYLPLQPHGVRKAGAANLDRLLGVFADKERYSWSHSFREVFELGVELMDRDRDWTWEKYLDRFMVAERINDMYDCFAMKYEDFTDNRLEPLSEYLGLHVEPVVPDNVENQNGHVVRSATHGDWRSWFVPSDIDFFRPMFKQYMDAFHYDDDWSLATEPAIPHETASGYVVACRPLVEEKMARRFAPKVEWRPELVDDEAAAEVVRAAADEGGAALHGNRYAVLLLEGRVAPRDPARAFRYAYRAALIGNLSAMELVARMYREGLGVERDEEQAAVWDREADVLRGPPAPKAPPAPAGAPAAPPAAGARPKAPTTPPSSFTRVVRKLKRVAARGMRTGRRTGVSGG